MHMSSLMAESRFSFEKDEENDKADTEEEKI